MKSKISSFWLPFFSGLMTGIARLPFHLNFIVFISLVPLLFFFKDNNQKRNYFIAGFAFSFSYVLTSLHWVALVTVPGFIGIIFLFAGYYYVLFNLMGVFIKENSFFKYASFISLWLSFEFLQYYGEFRFPWINIAYSLSPYILLNQIADFGGVYIISFLILLVNVLFYKTFEKLSIKFVTAIFIIFALWLLSGYFELNNLKLKNENCKIGIAQGNIPQELKWEKSYLDTTFQIYKKLSQEAAEQKSDLIVWPESSVPGYLLKYHSLYKKVNGIASKIKKPLFVGFPDFSFAPKTFQKYKYYNSATLIHPNGMYDSAYNKNYLVPVGERMPLLKIFPFLWKLNFGQANFEYGKDAKYYSVKGFKFSPLICFEIAFPDLTARIANHNADFILNLTNDAWFKHSVGTYQHAEMVKYRAIETRTMIYRAANTGISEIVSPTGQIVQKLDISKRGIIDYNLITSDKKTFYIRYFDKFKSIILWISAILFIIKFMSKTFLRIK
jgi:apolipoprotein N-acyltransferase